MELAGEGPSVRVAMTPTLDPIDTDRLRLVIVPPDILATIAATGGRPRAGDLPISWPGIGEIPGELVGTIPAVLRHAQATASPAALPWLVRIILVPQSEPPYEVVGHIGGHGPPDDNGAVEIGYTVARAWRRQGIATEAAAAWFHWAHGNGARRARLATTEDNVASLAIAARLGLHHVGQTWEEDDAVWEQIFEGDLPLAPLTPSPGLPR